MLLCFGFLYKLALFYFFFVFQKAENNRLKKSLLAIIIFLFLHNIGLAGPLDQQTNVVLA